MLDTIIIPEGLQRLPVAKQIQDIRFDDKAFLARAATASGKTMVIAPVESLLRRASGKTGAIAIRVPTKVTGTFVASGLRKMWGDRLNIASLNSDVSPFEAEQCRTADIVIISDGSLSRLMGLTEVAAYYCDEAHWLSLNAELDLAIAKRKGLAIRLLSATVDPKLFLDYLGPGSGNYVLEGRSFPIAKHTIWASADVFKRNDHEELYALISDEVGSLRHHDESAIFFLPTRQMCEDAATHFANAIPTTFVHGGVSPTEAEKWVDDHAGKPFMVFSTTAAATGCTLDLHRAYIADEVIDSVMERGIERMASTRMGDNMLLQASGRAGRLRAGNAYLITHDGYRNRNDGDPWLHVKPRPVEPPSEKSTPYEVVMTLAQHGIINDEDIDLLGKLDPNELRHARAWLRSHGCIKDDGALTQMGRLVAAFPAATPYAHLILSAPSKPSQLVLAAAFSLGLQGTYGLLKVKPRSKELAKRREDDPDWPLLDPDLVVMDSVPMSMARIMQVALQQGDINKWCDQNNLWSKSVWSARKDFLRWADFIFKGNVSQALKMRDMEDPALMAEVHNHLRNHSLYKHSIITGGGGGGGIPNLFDSVFADCFGLTRPPAQVEMSHVWSIPTYVNLPRFRFWALEMPIREPIPPEPEPETLEETT